MTSETVRLSLCSVLLVASCQTLEPPETLIDLKTRYGTVNAVSTEHGIVALSEVVADREEVDFRYHVGNGMFDDVATVESRGPWLTLLEPVSTRPNEARIAGHPATGDDTILIESRGEDGPELLEVELYNDGELGNLLVPVDGTTSTLASELAGSAVYVVRDDHLQIVGILNGLYLDSPSALAYIGLDEMSYLVSEANSYFERDAIPRRADFEYGVPRDFAGERVFASGAGEVPDYVDDGLPPPTEDPGALDLETLLRDLGNPAGTPPDDDSDNSAGSGDG